MIFGFYGTYSSQLHVLGNAVLPCKAEDVWKVEGEVDDAAAGGCQVGLIEEDAHQETLHDRGHGESQQEKEDEQGVAVIQHLPTLSGKKRCTCCEGFIKVLFLYKQGQQSKGSSPRSSTRGRRYIYQSQQIKARKDEKGLVISSQHKYTHK